MAGVPTTTLESDAAAWADCRAAALRTAAWAGQVISAADLSNGSLVSLGLYKGLIGFDKAGQAETLAILLRAVEQSAYRDGDFHAQCIESPFALVNTYRNGWFAAGAQRLAAYHLSAPALDRMERAMHPLTGGIASRDNVDPGQRLYDLGSNASAVEALLTGGRIQAAQRVGSFMAQMLLRQASDTTQLHLAQDAAGRPFDPNAHGLAPARGLFVFDVGAPQQIYWPLGFALRAFALLARATGASAWLEPALRVGDWLERSHADQAEQITSAKLGWGAAHMFAVTSDPAWAKLALRALGHIVRTQTEQGSWLRPEHASLEAQPMPVTLDTSIERMVYLLDIPLTLAASGWPIASSPARPLTGFAAQEA